ncbi:MAG: PD-(D/E)XK nuclease family protein [Synergistaceae bacterium]|nr:PD-(D/E)XK nuclease family protein [Synergistaceae bacterium]MBR0184801.1 PD-(D/E)XK nuclease family protein [Synergistaceae bacterium]
MFDSSNDGMSLSLELSGGIITAHPDCIISRDDSGLILADIKTMNDRSFRSLKHDGTVKSHPHYADQLTIYAQALRECGHSIEQLAIVALNKNNCEGYIDYFPFEPERYKTLKERAEKIFAIDEAPEQGNRFQGWCCDYCGYAHLCELAKKDTVVGDESVPETDNQEVIDAVELLSESRDMEKVAKELSDEAKAVLDREVRKQDIKSVRAGNLVLVLNEIKSSRLDTTALKKAHPELVSEFMKQSSSVRYDLKEVA